MAGPFFGGQFFGGGFFQDLVPDVIQVEQASNWQATYWKHKSKADRENEEMLERIKLGILPPPLAEVAAQAVADADQAALALTARTLEPSAALLRSMEAREAYENAYRTAYQEAYVAEIVANQWMTDMKKLTRRRKAIALLLN